jgi:hypothetical protein
MSTAYSSKTLYQKLEFRPGCSVWLVDPPLNYQQLLGKEATETVFLSQPQNGIDAAHGFVNTRTELSRFARAAKRAVRAHGAIWVSWPKKTSALATELDENAIREIVLPMGLVDTKVCAVDETWSGLKLLRRRA